MKSIVFAGGISALVLATVVPAVAQTAVPKEGGTCKTANQKLAGRTLAGTSALLTCTKVGTKLVWKAPVVAPTTKATVPAPAPTVAGAAPAPATTAPADVWPAKLVFAGVPSENAARDIASWGPFLRALEDELSKTRPIKVEQVTTTSYAGVTEGIIANKVDLASYGPFSYYVAQNSGAKLDAVAVGVNFGSPATYQSFFFTKSSRTDINSLADAKGKKICFVDPQSTSGYLYPFLMLTDAGIDPVKDVTPTFAGTHPNSLLGVFNGTCDAGFAFDNNLERVGNQPATLAGGQVPEGALKVVFKSKPIPNSPIALRTTLPASLVAKIREVLPKLDSLYLQANKYCPSVDLFCGPGSVTPGRAASAASNATWIPVDDTFYKDIAAGCARPVVPTACKPA